MAEESFNVKKEKKTPEFMAKFGDYVPLTAEQIKAMVKK